MKPMPKAIAQEADDLVERIKLILAGHRPEAQGAALGELTAMWLSGFYPKEARPEILEAQIGYIRSLMAVNERTVQ